MKTVGEVKIQEQYERNYTKFSEKYKTCLLEVVKNNFSKNILKITVKANPSVVANLNLEKLNNTSEIHDGLLLKFSGNMTVMIRKCSGGARHIKTAIEKATELEKVSQVKRGPLNQITHHSNTNCIRIGRDLTVIPLRKRLSESPDEKHDLHRCSTSTPKRNADTGKEAISSEEDNTPLFTHVKKRRVSAEGSQSQEKMDMSWKNDDGYEMKQNSSEKKKTSPKSFLDKAEEKSKACEHNTSLSSKSFYKNSSDASDRALGSFGMSSSSKNYSKKRPEKKLLSTLESKNYQWKEKSTAIVPIQSSLRGFSNLGNTCYMNAILQSLFALESFADDLMFLQKQTQTLANCQKSLFCLLGNLLESQKKKLGFERQDKCLSEVKQAISVTAKRFSGKEQHDAHEFLSQVIDQVKEEAQKENKTAEQTRMKKANNNESEQGVDEKRDIMKDRFINPTIMNFEFEILHTITCLKCSSEVKKIEIFHDLSIDMPKRMNCDEKSTLQDALDQFFQHEKIEYTCEKCQHKQVEVGHTVYRAPRIVVLQLKRYRFNTVTTQNKKLGRSIRIPRFLTLSEHCTQETSPPFFIDMRDFYKTHHRDVLASTENTSKTSNYLDLASEVPTRSKFAFRKLSAATPGKDFADGLPPLKPKYKSINPEIAALEKEKEDEELAQALAESRSEKEKSDRHHLINEMSEEAQMKIAMELSMCEDKTQQNVSTCRSAVADIEMSQDLGSAAPPRSRSPKSCSKKLKLEDAGGDSGGFDWDEENRKMEEKRKQEVEETKVKKHTFFTEYMTLSSDSESERMAVPEIRVDQPMEDLTEERKEEKKADVQMESPKSQKTSPQVNKTSPIVLNSDPDWLSAKKEQLEIDKAMELSLKDTQNQESKEAEDMKRAIANSLKDHDQSLPLEETFLEEPIPRSVHSTETIQENLNTGNLPFSYRLVSIVSHFGSSNAGHYISDVYNAEKGKWFSFNDRDVSQMSEESVQQNRENTGYIFFYVNSDIMKDLEIQRKEKESASKENVGHLENKLKQPSPALGRRSAPMSLNFMNTSSVF